MTVANQSSYTKGAGFLFRCLCKTFSLCSSRFHPKRAKGERKAWETRVYVPPKLFVHISRAWKGNDCYTG